MFGGKRRKALEEELAAVKKENERKTELFFHILEQKDVVSEQFARMTASRAQIEKSVAQIKEEMQRIYQLAADSKKTAEDLCYSMTEAGQSVDTFDVNYAEFMSRIRKQDACIMEIVESNKHFTTPMKHITETQATYRKDHQTLGERAERMLELTGNMSVLALNAAIEAGKIEGMENRFVAAAEEIHTFSEKYEKEAKKLLEHLEQSEQNGDEMEEQIHYLNELLKENNISMSRLYKDSNQNISSYEQIQTEIQNLIPREILRGTDALKQSEETCVELQESLLLQLEEIWEEIEEYKNSTDELEILFKELHQAAYQGSANS